MNYLKYILELVTNLNQLFQRESPTIFLLHPHTEKLYRTILSDFCRSEVVVGANLQTFDPSLPVNHKPFTSIYLGAENRALMMNEPYVSNPRMVH